MQDNPLKRSRLEEDEVIIIEDDSDLISKQQDEIAVLLIERDQLKRANAVLKQENRVIRDEYVNRILPTDKLFTESCRVVVDNVPQPKTTQLLKDGRAACHFVGLWLRSRWTIPARTQIKMFTNGGCNTAPSKDLGTGREVTAKDVVDNINDHPMWLFVDIRQYPSIRYIQKSNDKVLRLARLHGTKGHVSSFDSIINA